MARSAKRQVGYLTGIDVGVDNEVGRILVNMQFFSCSCERSYVHTLLLDTGRFPLSYLLVTWFAE